MRLIVKANKIELSTALRAYCQVKMDKIEKYLGTIKALGAEISVAKEVGGQRQGKIFRAEANLRLPGNLLRVEKSATDLYKAIDKVEEHLERVIKKYKDKLAVKNKKLHSDVPRKNGLI